MSRSLYFLNDPHIGGITFGLKPYDDKHSAHYGRMNRRIGLKSDLKWRERQELQNILRRADIWEDFPARGYTMVAAEFKAGDEEQRIDLLYIRSDGGLLPCELKIGGTSLDSHGQLIRYISDLQFQDIGLDWVRRYHHQFLSTIEDDLSTNLHANRFDEFIGRNRIEERVVRILPKSGIIMDEDFRPQLLKAVRYLNEYCGFAIRLIQIETYIADDWHNEMQGYLFRVDFTDVQ